MARKKHEGGDICEERKGGKEGKEGRVIKEGMRRRRKEGVCKRRQRE